VAFTGGALVGLVVGLGANPRTAWVAVFEVGIPSAIVGGLVGLVGGTVATGFSASDGDMAHRSTHRRTEPRWPVAVVALATLTVLHALRSMDWASRVDELGVTTFDSGPTGLLASSALGSLVLSAIVIVTRWHRLRWFLLATTLTTAFAAVVVALSRIAAANDDSGYGFTKTSYEPGAAVGVGTAFVAAAFALIGFYNASMHPSPLPPGFPSPPSDPAP
jgi:hypothetical protein